uniref:Putative secreted protein n=1 Tax=Psorophora albipes TaxID=869069 RepID=T1D5Z0_9DIPT
MLTLVFPTFCLFSRLLYSQYGGTAKIEPNKCKVKSILIGRTITIRIEMLNEMNYLEYIDLLVSVCSCN